MLIDKTYFTGKLNLPNVEQGTVNQDLILNNNELHRFIQEYELKYLTDAFGFIVARDILSKIDSDGNIIAGTEQKYIDLIDGVDDWLGLRYEANGIKYSQVANYVYCMYIAENERKMTNLGVTVDEVEKGRVVSSWSKYNSAWRDMFKQRQAFELDDWYSYSYYLNTATKTLFDYITGNTDWDTQYFISYNNTNSLGI